MSLLPNDTERVLGFLCHARSPLNALSQVALSALSAILRVTRFAAGEAIEHGESSFCLLLSGSLEVTGPKGTFHVLEPGDVIGEVAMLPCSMRVVVRGRKAGQVAQLSKDALSAFVERHPGDGLLMFRALGHHSITRIIGDAKSRRAACVQPTLEWTSAEYDEDMLAAYRHRVAALLTPHMHAGEVELQDLLESVQYAAFGVGQVVLEEGQRSDRVMVVLSGGVAFDRWGVEVADGGQIGFLEYLGDDLLSFCSAIVGVREGILASFSYAHLDALCGSQGPLMQELLPSFSRYAMRLCHTIGDVMHDIAANGGHNEGMREMRRLAHHGEGADDAAKNAQAKRVASLLWKRAGDAEVIGDHFYLNQMKRQADRLQASQQEVERLSAELRLAQTDVRHHEMQLAAATKRMDAQMKESSEVEVEMRASVLHAADLAEELANEKRASTARLRLVQDIIDATYAFRGVKASSAAHKALQNAISALKKFERQQELDAKLASGRMARVRRTQPKEGSGVAAQIPWRPQASAAVDASALDEQVEDEGIPGFGKVLEATRSTSPKPKSSRAMSTSVAGTWNHDEAQEQETGGLHRASRARRGAAAVTSETAAQTDTYQVLMPLALHAGATRQHPGPLKRLEHASTQTFGLGASVGQEVRDRLAQKVKKYEGSVQTDESLLDSIVQPLLSARLMEVARRQASLSAAADAATAGLISDAIEMERFMSFEDRQVDMTCLGAATKHRPRRARTPNARPNTATSELTSLKSGSSAAPVAPPCSSLMRASTPSRLGRLYPTSLSAGVAASRTYATLSTSSRDTTTPALPQHTPARRALLASASAAAFAATQKPKRDGARIVGPLPMMRLVQGFNSEPTHSGLYHVQGSDDHVLKVSK